MSEEKNIPPEEIPQEQPVNKEPADETISSVEPVTEAEQPQTTNYKLQTEEEMEVHHHPHPGHHKKKWTDYFWEFLMLFLAVFCGFLAEYQLEHVIEKNREKEYMSSLVQDLRIDQANLTKIIADKSQKLSDSDSLMYLFENPDYANTSGHLYYYGRRLFFASFFEITDGTIQQLKNAGGFRLIRKRDVVDSIQSYTYAYNRLKTFLELESQQIIEFRQTSSVVFDVFVFEKMLKGSSVIMPEGNPALLSNKKEDINKMLMNIHSVKRNRIIQVNNFGNLKEKGARLISLIKKEYHLENE